MLTVKYDMEKSFGDSLINIKKQKMEENQIMKFDQWLNEMVVIKEESDKNSNILVHIVQELLKKMLVDKKLPFEIVEPVGSKTTPKFHDDVDKDGGSFDENLVLGFTDEDGVEAHISVDFTWSYDHEDPKYKGSNTQPADPNIITLTDLDFTSIVYSRDDDKPSGELPHDPSIILMLSDYIEQNLPIDGKTYTYQAGKDKLKSSTL